jgi:hypothetical protein
MDDTVPCLYAVVAITILANHLTHINLFQAIIYASNTMRTTLFIRTIMSLNLLISYILLYDAQPQVCL